MRTKRKLVGTLAALALASAWLAPARARASEPLSPSRSAHRHAVLRLSPRVQDTLDRSGRTRLGIASFYAGFFAGRTMADGTPMRPEGNNAASRTLPLGTTAQVIDLNTGRSAIVTIRDRGPYVAGRIVDLSPATARQIGLDRKSGLAKVAVAPIYVPLGNGELKAGAAAAAPSSSGD